MPKPWRTLTAPVIVLILTAPAILSAQPLQLPRGTEINVKLGGGTSFQEGTRLTLRRSPE